ncbi:NDR1/HIN1-like protein 3 [Rhododendron vialii]|uniref:NDR1/HIN1-like protein 3 n=1 Tax=Rhododendron vialii TaxID=182163 RepID=UPI00265E4B2D|nr:NDR1/HIN1-like protein 3 [Rhododendron vialii]
MSSPKQPHLNGAYYGPSIPPPSKSYHRPGRGSSCNPLSCLCGCVFNLIFKILFTVLFTAGLVIFLFWLALRPINRVKFHVTDAALTKFSLNTTTTGNNLYYNLDLNLTIRNPNKHIGIYYDSVEARAFYGGQRFATKTLPRFYQGKKNTTVLNVVLEGQDIAVNNDLLSDYNSEKGSGVYSIDVKLYLRVRFKLRDVKTPRFKPKIECDLKVPLDSNNGTASGTFQTTKCGFDW